MQRSWGHSMSDVSEEQQGGVKAASEKVVCTCHAQEGFQLCLAVSWQTIGRHRADVWHDSGLLH